MSENNLFVVDKEELRALVADALELPVDDVTDDAHFIDDLEVDSLMALEITVRLEKRFAIKIEESDFAQVTSMVQVAELAAAKLREKAG